MSGSDEQPVSLLGLGYHASSRVGVMSPQQGKVEGSSSLGEGGSWGSPFNVRCFEKGLATGSSGMCAWRRVALWPNHTFPGRVALERKLLLDSSCLHICGFPCFPGKPLQLQLRASSALSLGHIRGKENQRNSPPCPSLGLDNRLLLPFLSLVFALYMWHPECLLYLVRQIW